MCHTTPFHVCTKVEPFTHKCANSHACTTINFGVTPGFQIPLLHLWQPAQTAVARIMRDSKTEHSRKSEPSFIFQRFPWYAI